jgi:hypothetical protein
MRLVISFKSRSVLSVSGRVSGTADASGDGLPSQHLLELSEELGRGALGSAVCKMEDWSLSAIERML